MLPLHIKQHAPPQLYTCGDPPQPALSACEKGGRVDRCEGPTHTLSRCLTDTGARTYRRNEAKITAELLQDLLVLQLDHLGGSNGKKARTTTPRVQIALAHQLRRQPAEKLVSGSGPTGETTNGYTQLSVDHTDNHRDHRGAPAPVSTAPSLMTCTPIVVTEHIQVSTQTNCIWMRTVWCCQPWHALVSVNMITQSAAPQ